MRGIFDGFEGYATRTTEGHRRAMTSGMVVLDTNVLLNLYRYTASARNEFLSLLERIAESLWVPHQVMQEFWHKRDSTLRAPVEIAEEVLRDLEKHRNGALERLRYWGSRTGFPSTQRKEFEQKLVDVFKVVEGQIDALSDVEVVEAARDTNTDPVVRCLESLLKGRVGPAMGEEALERARAEGKRRIDNRLPPGFKDRHKDDELAVGDYLLWEQILMEAEDRRVDVLLVTGDVKEDWWRIERGVIRGPRPELASEMTTRAGVQLLMLRPDSFIAQASSALDVPVDDTSVQDIERVDRIQSSGVSAWTSHAANELLDRLDYEDSNVQAEAIRCAVATSGFVSRDMIYEIGGYDDSRTLRGFTRPANRIAQDLRDESILAVDAADPLTAVYDGAVSYVQAAGFQVPEDLVASLIE
jgi:predicted nucleic acid-binding protein